MRHRILQHEYRSSLYKLQDRLKEFRRSHGWCSGHKPFLLELLNPCIIWPVIKQVSILTSMIKNKYTRSADRILLMLIDPSWGTVDEISNASYIYYPHQKSQQQHCCHQCFRLISTKFRPNSDQTNTEIQTNFDTIGKKFRPTKAHPSDTFTTTLIL